MRVRRKKRQARKSSGSLHWLFKIAGWTFVTVLVVAVVIFVMGPPRDQTLPPLSHQPLKSSKPALILVLDDAGHNLSQLKKMVSLPFPLAVAVLPHLPFSTESARLIHESGKTVMVHMPMEPLGSADPGPGAIFEGDSPEEIRRKIQEAVKSVPFAVGLNNHMGSKVTSNYEMMKTIIEEVDSLGLFFLDSLTSSRSAARKAAGDLNISLQERTVFLDNEKNREYILEAFEEGKAMARTKGHAIMIGHVWTEELADVLLEIYPRLIDDGFDIQEISAFLEGKDIFHTGEEMFLEEEYGF